jgi:endonuclease/exonuclease/phosphatase family metal-dependent hydrolase
LLLVAGCAGPANRTEPAPRDLKIATWNLEHLAESEGVGCRARNASDYQSLRRYADQLDADVIAFEEVESEAAAARVFPPDRYTIVISGRPESGRRGTCNDRSGIGPELRSQKVGFAVRKGIAFERHPDVRELGLGNPDLRWGVDITVQAEQPLRLLAVHLKSGCSAGSDKESCGVLFRQIPIVERWMNRRRDEGAAFAILGDWNRRLAQPGDSVWEDLAGGQSAGAMLVNAAEGRRASCLQRYPDFIDHIVLDPRAAARKISGSFEEFSYGVDEESHPSDHCPIAISLR